jgi:hypothetical protein
MEGGMGESSRYDKYWNLGTGKVKQLTWDEVTRGKWKEDIV